MAEGTKTCTRCGETKPLDGFHRAKSGKSGRQSHCKACRAEYRAEYYERNREAERARNADWYAANRESVITYTAERYAANPHLRWEAHARERAKKYGHTITVERFTREQLIDRYGDQCWHCGGEFEELDHWPVPVSRGGHHVIENCKPSCASCNQKSWRNDSEAA